MNREGLYEVDDDDDDDDDIGEDLEELRQAFIVTEAKGLPSDSENDEEDDLEMLRSIKSQLASSTTNVGLSVPSDSESENDFEMLRSIKSQLALSMDEDEDEDGAFETLGAIRRRFFAYENFDVEGNFMNDSSPGKKKKQVHASDNEPSTEILSRSNTCESFPDHGKSAVTVPDSETSIEQLDHLETCQSSLMPATNSGFPEAALAFLDAIRKNRLYQSFLRRKLSEIEATIEQNEKHSKNVKIVKDFQASCKRITKQALSQGKDPRVELISTPKSRPASDSSGGNDKKTSYLTMGPPENACVANYRMALEKYPVSVDRANWTTKEKENLAKGLKQQVQDTLIREAFERSSDLEGSADDINTILEGIKSLEITPEMIRQFLPKVNWDQLDIKNRSAAECEARWMSSDDPLINNGPWTVAEDNYIRLFTKNKGFTDWLDIAVSLGTNRTPFQCLARYQRSLNPDILRKEWTAEEDDQLRAAVDLFGESDWQSVANVLQGRTGPQCSNRWKKSLHPSRTRKRNWSSEEDKRLKVAVTLFGTKNWRKIDQFVPGRTGTQCLERWGNSLDPKLKFGKWTKEEDAKLREAMKEHGYCWSKVASDMSCRTDSQCARRWKSLYPHLAHLRQEARRLQKEATIGNFVDRESERPDRVVGDFLALAEISLEPEEPVLTKKRKPRQTKKADTECESEAVCADTERQPKKQRKGLERCSGDVCRKENEKTEDNVKEKKQRRKRTSVAGTSNNSSVTTNCPQVKIGIQKLKPRRKVSALVPIENLDAQN
ncbi:unnamed protein product [Arabidopsis halleri]